MSSLPKRPFKFAAIAAVGPISGPLLARALHHAKSGNEYLAALYFLATVEWIFLLYLLADKVMPAFPAG